MDHIKALESAWQDQTKAALAKLREAIADGQALNATRYATVAGIGTDKMLVLSGRPTNITANFTEIRYTLPALAAKLTRIAGRVIEVKALKPADELPVSLSD